MRRAWLHRRFVILGPARLAGALAALAALAAPAAAQFDLLNWTFHPSSGDGSGSLTGSEMFLEGPNSGCGMQNDFVAYTAVAPFAGTLIVTADYTCYDEEPQYDNFNFLLNGGKTVISQSNGWNGQLVLDVPAGATFGFSVGTVDCQLGEGEVLLTGFGFLPHLGPQPTLDGAQAGEHFGAVLAAAGDVDGDGVTDLLVGVPDANVGGAGTGRISVVSGALDATLLDVAGGAAGDAFGFAVAGGEDVNDDGFADLLVGAPKADTAAPLATDAGRVVVLSGVDGSVLHAFAGAKAFDKLGSAVAFVGDVDGDGIADLAAGAPLHDEVASNAGQVVVYSGATGALLLSLNGSDAGDQFGFALAGAGDIDGDGVPDVVVGSPGVNGPGWNVGRVTVHSGADGSTLLSLEHSSGTTAFGTVVAGGGDVNGDGTPDVVGAAPTDKGLVFVHSGADGSVLYTFTGGNSYDDVGAALAFAGDMDNDGCDDLIVGEPQFAFGGKGCARLRSGRTGVTLFILQGDEPMGSFGAAVTRVGDADGDGAPELAVGAPFSDLAGLEAGQVRLIEPFLSWKGDGLGLPGFFGVPRLTGFGLLGGGAPVKLLLDKSLPHTTAALVAGFAKALAPLKGGVLVPSMDLLVPGLLVSNDGTLPLSFAWPAGLPPGFELWLQMWIVDPTGPQGLTASNGLRAETPP